MKKGFNKKVVIEFLGSITKPYDYIQDEYGEKQWQNLEEALEDGMSPDDLYGVKSELLVDDHHGTYVPQFFYEVTDFKKFGLKKSNYKELANPDNDSYWDVWTELTDKAKFIDKGKKTVSLYGEPLEYRVENLDGGCFMVAQFKLF